MEECSRLFCSVTLTSIRRSTLWGFSWNSQRIKHRVVVVEARRITFSEAASVLPSDV